MIWDSALANGFRVAKNIEQAKIAFEKASQGQEMLSSYPRNFLVIQLMHLLLFIIFLGCIRNSINSVTSFTSKSDHGMRLSTWSLLLL